MQTGRRLALDVGKARIGVAISDFHGILASPLGVCLRAESIEASVENWKHFLAQHIDEIGASFITVYVGLPVNLQGDSTASTQDAIAVGNAFAGELNLEPRFVDERLSTVSAAAQLRASGFDSRGAKSKIDAAAATLILEQALNLERSGAGNAGKSLGEVNDAYRN